MKKVLLCVIATFFLFACSTTQKLEIPRAELEEELAKYRGVCADKYFEKVRYHLDQEHLALLNENHSVASIEREFAIKAYDKAIVEYNEFKALDDKVRSIMNSQKVRLDNVRREAMTLNAAKYNAVAADVKNYHADAVSKLDKCKPGEAEVFLKYADGEISDLEAFVKTSLIKKETLETFQTYVVKKGDTLWAISAKKLSNPFFWPLIYWSNKKIIKDPDLIYPNQKFRIEDQYSKDEKAKADNFARTRGSWSLYDNK